MLCVTAGKVSHNASNASGVTAGKMGRNSSHYKESDNRNEQLATRINTIQLNKCSLYLQCFSFALFIKTL